MPKFLEKKLKKEYGADSDIPYKVMNKLGMMKGNKETKKGKLAEKKHKVAGKMKKGDKYNYSEKELFEHHAKEVREGRRPPLYSEFVKDSYMP